MADASGVWLATARLKLRPLTLGDESNVLQGLNDPEIASWLATTPFPYAAEDYRSYVRTATMGETFAIHDASGFVGLIGGGAQLGFWIARRAQGQGYAVEAAVGLLGAVFEFFEGPVTSGYFVGNIRSARVLARLGFIQTGRAPVFSRPLLQDVDHVSMVLTRARFRAHHPV